MKQDKNRYIRDTALGWLEIEIAGEYAERLLNLALQQGIELNQVRYYGDTKISARILLRDIYLLRSLARSSRCHFRIKKRRGWPFAVAKAGRRRGFLLGGLIFAAALALFFSVVWRVEVTSTEPITANQRLRVIDLAEQAGLTIGTFSWLLDYQHIADQIMLMAADELIFVEISRTGSTAYIQAVWRVTLAEEDQIPPPGEIIANADGIIESLLVLNGTAAVAVGDTVKAGDILVYGYIGTELVAAAAIIEARVWGHGAGSWPLEEHGIHASGQVTDSWQLRFGSTEVDNMLWLSQISAAPYPLFRHSEQVFIPVLWRNIELPVEIIKHTWYEEHEYTTIYSEEQALHHAWMVARGRAVEQLPHTGHIQDEFQTRGVVNGYAEVRVTLEAVAEIGVYQMMDAARLQQYEQFLTQLQQEQEQVMQ